MPPALPAFDVCADTARNDPQAFYACRDRLIGGTIARGPAPDNLHALQAAIDVRRSSLISPRHNVRAIMDMLADKLDDLTDQLDRLRRSMHVWPVEAADEVGAAIRELEALKAATETLRAGVAGLAGTAGR
ncbi:MAG: DUF3135 domain-containing protein [Dechloromonas sp.]|nr:MAG: DUF3135 domain-containing protein [Dechloromonas sp.]